VLGDTVLTDDCVEYLTSLKTPPSEMHLAAGAVWFRWANGAWARCQLLAMLWPDGIFDRILEGVSQQEAPCVLTPEWREAFADAAALCDNGTITIRSTGIHARSEHGEHLVEFTTGAVRETYWSLATLKPLFASGASAWNPDAEGAALFAGDGVRGVVVRQRR
jgi:hypothetical protein